MRFVCLLIFLAGLSNAVFAQQVMFVRVSDSAPEELRASLESGLAKTEAFAPYFTHTVNARRVFPELGLIYRVEFSDTALLPEEVARWEDLPGVMYAQPNHRYELSGGMREVVQTDSVPHLDVIRATRAWAVTRGRGARIGFIDTGVWPDHPAFVGRLWVNSREDLNGNGRIDPEERNGRDDSGNGYADDFHGFDFVDRARVLEPGDYRERDNEPWEDPQPGFGYAHGTSVASVLAGSLSQSAVGVAPEAHLVSLRAFGADGAGEDDDIVAAILYAAYEQLDVVNMSFGDAYYSPLMHDAIRYATARGVTIVASAGNTGGQRPHYPSDYPEVISVAWLSSDGSGMAPSATGGPGVDLGAPASGVFTAVKPRSLVDPEGSTSVYGRRSGSSFAAPQVAGAVALLRALRPDLSPEAIRTILTRTARPLPNADPRAGAGLLDVEAAILQALPGRVALLNPTMDGGIGREDLVPLIGTVHDPALNRFTVRVSPGHASPFTWTNLAEGEGPRFEDTLAVWNIRSLPAGPYTLEVRAERRSGPPVVVQNRVTLRRTPPTLTVRHLAPALDRGQWRFALDAETDVPTLLHVLQEDGSQTSSDRLARRHGLVVPLSRSGGNVRLQIVATHASGWEARIDTTLAYPASFPDASLLESRETSMPAGYLLSRALDYNRDGFPEVMFNVFEQGWLSDSLAVYRWHGEGFAPVARLPFSVFPRDAGDTRNAGVTEVLTQVLGATLLLEASEPLGMPNRIAFIDTVGLRFPLDANSLYGAGLWDYDGSGQAAIVGHNTRAWRILRRGDTGAFAEITRLTNPTPTGTGEISGNELSEPVVLTGDFDGDGQQEMLSVDADGDLFIYEFQQDRFVPTFQHTTDRYGSRVRLAKGDLTGDGKEEFVTFTHRWPGLRADYEYEPPLGWYDVWTNTGDNQFEILATVPVWGPLSRHGSLAVGHVLDERQASLVIVQSPDLYVLHWDGTSFVLRYHLGEVADVEGLSGVRAVQMLLHDFTRSGRADLLLPANNGTMRLLTAPGEPRVGPPIWEQAYPLSESRVFLSWWSAGADSVRVYTRTHPTDTPRWVATATVDSLEIPLSAPSWVALERWSMGQASPLSEFRRLVPEPLPAFLNAYWRSRTQIELLFSGPVEATSARFTAQAEATVRTVLSTRNGLGLLLTLSNAPENLFLVQSTTLRSAAGAPIAPVQVSMRPEVEPAALLITNVVVADRTTLEVSFSTPVEESTALNVQHYALFPAGEVEEVALASPTRVVLRISGLTTGATGRSHTLRITEVRGRNGEAIPLDAREVELAQAATSLEDAYVYPNPVRVQAGETSLMLAELPDEVSVLILSADGGLVRRIEDRSLLGGISWDLRDESGRDVPSGVYTIRVTTPGGESVLLKAAILR